MSPRRSILVFAAAALLGACATSAPAATDSAQSTVPSTRPARTAVPAEPVPSASAGSVVGEVSADLLARILDDASERTGIDAQRIEVTTAETVTWPDGSLGCPEPGQVYTQSLVPGFQVVLTAGDDELDYRATENGSFRLCESGRRPGGG